MIERADHEKMVCLAVLEAMEAREGAKFDDLSWADEVERNREAVDLMFRSSTTRYALEHTRIESFEDQIEHFHQTRAWVGALRSRLEGSLPRPGHFVISFEPGVAAGHKPRTKTIEALAEWVRSRAPSLELGSPQTAPHHWLRERPEGLPFEITLTRWPRMDGELHFSDFVPDDLEGRRRYRIRSALESKLPKLSAATLEGATSILVLESDDIALASAWSISYAFAAEMERLQDAVPDSVWLVEADSEPWQLWELKRGREVFGANMRKGYHEIDSRVREELLLKWSLRFRQGSWTRFSQWESGQARERRSDFGRALAWMWEAWQLARSHDPAWGRLRAGDAHVRQLREATDALRRLRSPA